MTDRQGNRRGPTPVVYGVPTSHGHRADDAPDTSDETTVQPRVTGGSRAPAEQGGGRRPAQQSNGNGNGAAPTGRPAAAPTGPPSSSAPPPAANRGSGTGSRTARPADGDGQWFSGAEQRSQNAAPQRPPAAAADAPTQIRSGGGASSAPPAPTAPPSRGKSEPEQATRPSGGSRTRSPLTDPALVRPAAPTRPAGAGRAAATEAAGAAAARAATPPSAPERPRDAPARPDAARTATPNRADAPDRPAGPTQDTVVGGQNPVGRPAEPRTEAFSRNSPPVATPEPPRAAPRQPEPPVAAFAAGAPTVARPGEQPHQGDGYARPQQQTPRRVETYDPGPEPYHPDLDADANRGASRRAHLRVSRVSPKSIFKISFMFSLCVFVIIIVAVAVLWFVLDSIGVFHSIESAAQTLTDKSNGGIDQWLGFQRIIGIAFIIGLVNVVLMTLLSTLGALLYNLCTDLVGGVEVTLTER